MTPFLSHSNYQKVLSDRVLGLRDRKKLTFNAIAENLILDDYRSSTLDMKASFQSKKTEYPRRSNESFNEGRDCRI